MAAHFDLSRFRNLPPHLAATLTSSKPQEDARPGRGGRTRIRPRPRRSRCPRPILGVMRRARSVTPLQLPRGRRLRKIRVRPRPLQSAPALQGPTRASLSSRRGRPPQPPLRHRPLR
jgi:hypothetical protein